MRRFPIWLFVPMMMTGLLHATSHCYKQRSNCFVDDDGKSDVKMYSKRDRFTKVAKKHGLSEKEINAMIKRGEGRSDENPRQEDIRDERGYYGGVYWPHPIYAYPPYYWDDDDHHHHPNKPPSETPGNRPPEKPTHGPITIQPTENPAFNRPGRPGGPSTQPVQRPSTKPVQRPTTRPVTKPQRPAARPRPRPNPRPRPRPVRRAR